MDANRLRELIKNGDSTVFDMAELKNFLWTNRHEIVRALEDAERYRWLRDHAQEGWIPLVRKATGQHMGVMTLDAAIDAAREGA